MKKNQSIIITPLLLGVLLHLPSSSAFSKAPSDSLVMDKMFAYKRNFASTSIKGIKRNTYIRYNFRIAKRNPLLLFVPTMYYIAKGRRNYVGEIYGTATFGNTNSFTLRRQVSVSTVPRRRRAMTTMAQFLTPDLYGEAMFHNEVLSPFNRNNRQFYRYRISLNNSPQACVTFKPRTLNAQLVSGFAIVDKRTGRIIRSHFSGEHDMLAFNVYIDMGESEKNNTLVPERCDVSAVLKFAGNEIRSSFKAYYNCPTTLPDSINDSSDRQAIVSLRPDSLSPTEKEAYQLYDNENIKPDSTTVTPTPHKENKLKKVAWKILSDNLLTSLTANSSKASIKMSPIVNPLYLSYSHSRGLSYKLKFRAHYNFTSNTSLAFTPDIGYNFKIKQIYFNSPLRFTYDKKHNGWIEFSWANGNQITNSSVLDRIRNERRDTIDFAALSLDYFKDEMWKLEWNTALSKAVSISTGTVYHRREGVNAAQLTALGKPTKYRSFAPFLTLTVQPTPKWPILTGNYERSIRHALKSDTQYERWEFDASYKKELSRLRQYSIRIGGGFYTNKSTSYFVDFDNFHENYVPGGWDDDWSGDFQLLNSQWYNASTYYFRVNASYESPLLFLTRLPLIGRYIETERLYLSSLQIEHTRPYSELGYAFTTRYFSVGLFGSFLNGKFNEFGSKFSFELFHNW